MEAIEIIRPVQCSSRTEKESRGKETDDSFIWNESDIRVRLDVNFIEGHVLDGYLVLFICVLLIRGRLFYTD